MPDFIFKKTLIIGVGLIGSSLARGLKNKKISNLVIGYDKNNEVKEKCKNLNFLDSILDNLNIIEEIDLIVLCSPLGSYDEILKEICTKIKSKCIITDVGSTKVSVVKNFNEC